MDSAPPTEFISAPLLVRQEGDKRADPSAECPVCVVKPSHSKAKPTSPVTKPMPPTGGGGDLCPVGPVESGSPESVANEEKTFRPTSIQHPILEALTMDSTTTSREWTPRGGHQVCGTHEG